MAGERPREAKVSQTGPATAGPEAVANSGLFVGDVIRGTSEDPAIGVALRLLESAGGVFRFAVEVHNRGDEERRFLLWVDRVSPDVVHFEPESQPYAVRPKGMRRVVFEVVCEAARPEAGTLPIQVYALNAANPREWGRSNEQPIDVPRWPGLRVTWGAPRRRARSGVYDVTALLANTGNVALSGTLLFDSERVGPPGRFRLAPDSEAGEAFLDFEVTFADQGLAARPWLADRPSMFHVVANLDGGGSLPCDPLVVQQRRLLDDLAGWLAALWRRARGVNAAWRQLPREPRRDILLVAAVTAAVLMLGACLVGRAGGADYGTPAAARTSASASPAPTSPTPAPTASTPPSPDASFYTAMPCRPGTFIVFLAAEATDADAAGTLEREVKRAKMVAPSLRYEPRASTWDQACEAARSYARTGLRLVWLGPVASSRDGKRLCAELGKPLDHDCLVRPVTPR